MTITNAAVAERACALAEASGGLQRMAALCVSAAAATTGTFRGARKALEAVPHSGLRDAAQVLLNQLADRPATAEVAASGTRDHGPRAGLGLASRSGLQRH